MLCAAGHAFAVDNAEPEVKAAAGRTVPSCDESAVAYIIEKCIDE